jgi:hypothetical protein
MRGRSRRMSRRRSRSKTRRPSATIWAPLVAVAVTAVLVGAARLLVGLRRRRPATGAGPGGAYAPEPLTGDPTSVAAEDVAPV